MIEVIWSSLLEIKRILSSCEEKGFSVQVTYKDNNFNIQVEVVENLCQPVINFQFGGTGYTQNESITFQWDKNSCICDNQPKSLQEEYLFLKTYLPYCFSAMKSHKLKRAYCVSHYAQSLDGKIATAEGNSKWISDQENLTHCHRMRALCDGILIGMNTLRNDKPQLNVRYVKGDSPVKIVVGNSSCSFSSLVQNKERVFYFTSRATSNTQNIEQVNLPATVIAPVFILESLYKMGIQSVLIEGGSQTCSSFLEYNTIDEIQLYLSPFIFGSGLPTFSLPKINQVSEAVAFAKHEFIPMGKGILFKGEVDKTQQRRT